MKFKLNRDAQVVIGIVLLLFAGFFLFASLHIPGEARFLEEVRAAEEKYGKNSSVVGIPLSQLAMLYMSTGHHDKAVATWERISRNDVASHGENSPQTASGLRLLARIYDETGHYAQADAAYVRILNIEKKLLAASAKAGGKPYQKNILNEARNAMEIYELNGNADAAARFRHRLQLMKSVEPGDKTAACAPC